jgi:hypothetical protein
MRRKEKFVLNALLLLLPLQLQPVANHCAFASDTWSRGPRPKKVRVA